MQNNKSAERDNINQNILNMEQKAPQKVLNNLERNYKNWKNK